jgi:hypothetical protein
MFDYQDDWWNKWSEQNKIPEQKEEKPLDESTLGKGLGLVGSLWGPLGKGAGAAVGSLLDTRPDPSGQNKLGRALDVGIDKAVNSYVTGAALGALGDVAKAADVPASTLGDVYKQTDLAPAMSMDYRLGAKIDALPEGMSMVPNEPSMWDSTLDKASTFGQNYIKGISKGLIGGDYTPIESSGSAGYDFFNALDKGGGIDKAVGNIRGGNYGGLAGQAASYAINSYSPEQYRKRSRY